MDIGRHMFIKRLVCTVLITVTASGCAPKGEADSGGEGPAASVSISPELPTTVDDLEALASALDGPDMTDEQGFVYRWFRDGEPTELTGSVLAAQETSKSESWSVEVRASGPGREGPPARSEPVDILNTPPGDFTLAMVPTLPRAGWVDLVCTVAVAPVDPDEEGFDYKMVWSKNSASFSETSTSQWPGDTISAAHLSEGDTWRCTAQAFDGDKESPPASVETVVTAMPAGMSAGDGVLSNADRWFIGHDDADFFGYDVDAVGDVDGDGVDDLLVSGHRMEGSGRNVGRTFVMSGARLAAGTTTDPEVEAMWVVEGADYFDFSGFAVADGGDVDGDGLSDLLISSHNTDELEFNAGSVALLTAADLGAAGVVSAASASVRFLGESRRAYTGFSVANAGDVDGDGWPDVLIGAMGNLDLAPYQGKAYLIRHAEYVGQSEVSLFESGTTLFGEHRRAYAGWSVAGVGDIDADGLDDIVVGACGTEMTGASQDQDEGAAYLVTGAQLAGVDELALLDAERRWVGTGFHDYVGYDVAGVGDVDNDGRPDLTISAFAGDAYGNYPGLVYLFVGDELPESGPITAAPVQFSPVGFRGQFGRRVSGAGDVDGDGRPDILIGAMTAGADEQGMAVLWLAADIGAVGTHDASDAYARISGDEAGSFVGAGLSIGGDYNDDGRADLAIGGHGAPSDVGRPGAMGVFFSR